MALRRLATCILLVFSYCCTFNAAALEPDQILLITNKNAPQGLKLAQFYADKRHVPDHRILELDLPTAEEMSCDAYERQVVPAVRAFLRDNGLERKIACLLTFYGVPIRVAARVNSAEDKKELEALKAELAALPARTEPLVQALEKLAVDADASFQQKPGGDLEALSHRADAAFRQVAARAAQADPAERERLQARSMEVLEPLMGKMGMMERRLKEALLAASRPAGTQPAIAAPTTQGVELFVQFRATLLALRERKYDADSRRQLRELVQRHLGPFEYARLLDLQIAHFQTENTAAAFDSELSMLWCEYPKSLWIVNPLHYGMPAQRSAPVMMVMRLDGPQSGTVSQIILTSLKAEAEGLKGRVVIDSRGLPAEKDGKPDPYGAYDQTLRNLEELVRTKTKLSMLFDDRPEVLAAGSAKKVAVYMGWYSVDKYVPACEFVPGAVGFHLASYTMVTLKKDDPKCWVRGMLNDGIAATLGPVAEPYLQAFPNADDFYPLLFTGKLTLAEVYWKTTPMASWMISMIGDPLYTPYKNNPALTVEDLPVRLQGIFASAPPTRP